MYSVTGNTTSLVLGFPIRTPSDQRSVGSSPRHIAASNVLHRLPVPRHPPCALKHLQHKNQKMSFKRNCTSTHTNATETRRPQPHPMRARCSQPLSTNQTPHPTTKVRQQHADTRNRMPPPKNRGTGLLSQSPIVCSAVPSRLLRTKPAPLQRSDSSRLHPHQLRVFIVVLLRKEVIQPHLPVRLPCYDFVPIADPTFDGSLHKG